MALVTVASPLGADLRWLFPSAYASFAAGVPLPQGAGIAVPIIASAGLGSEGFAAQGVVLRFEGPSVAFAGAGLTGGSVGLIELRGAGGAALLTLEAGRGGLGFAAANSAALALSGADTLLGGDGGDRLFGFGGDDTLRGGEGVDTLDGGEGRDTALHTTAPGRVTVDLERGTAFGTDGADTLLSIEDVTGGEGDDALLGDAGPNRLDGGAGSDALIGRLGDDALLGRDGNDVLVGGPGFNTLDGGGGFDTADYGWAQGGVFVDWDGGAATGPGWADALISVENAFGSAFADTFALPGRAPFATALPLNVFGGAGDDRFVLPATVAAIASPWADADGAPAPGSRPPAVFFLTGSDGSDTLDLSAPGLSVAVDLAAGTADAEMPTGPDRALWHHLLVSARGVENAVGSGGGDRLAGDGADNTLWGGRGADTLLGLGGDDRLAPGAGANRLEGGPGFDVADYGDHAGPVHASLAAGRAARLAPGPGGGEDALAAIEGLVGGGGDDVLAGDAGGNRLWGGAGADTLDGGEGDDAQFGGPGADALAGGAGDDALHGGVGAADLLDGGPGLDRYLVDDADDVAVVSDGTDFAFVAADGWAAPAGLATAFLVHGATTLDGSAGDDTLAANAAHGSLLRGGGGRDALWGREREDRLLGGPGGDALRGAGGDDTLAGGAGDDQLVGGAGLDRFVFDLPGWGYDQVFDFDPLAGDLLDFRGSGVASFAEFRVFTDGANTALVAADGSRVDLYGVAAVAAEHLLF